MDLPLAQLFMNFPQLQAAQTNLQIYSDTLLHEPLDAYGVSDPSPDPSRFIYSPLPYDLADPIHALNFFHNHCRNWCPLCQRFRQASGQCICRVTQEIQPYFIDPALMNATSSPTYAFKTAQMNSFSQHPSTPASENGLLPSRAPLPIIFRMESGQEARETINEVMQCDRCGAYCDTSHMARHLKFACPHSRRARVQCEDCNKWISRPDALRRHKISRACRPKINGPKSRKDYSLITRSTAEMQSCPSTLPLNHEASLPSIQQATALDTTPLSLYQGMKRPNKRTTRALPSVTNLRRTIGSLGGAETSNPKML